MDNNLIDISVSLYFEVSDAEVFGGKGCKGYTSVSYSTAALTSSPALRWTRII